jgi:hypothetical protein
VLNFQIQILILRINLICINGNVLGITIIIPTVLRNFFWIPFFKGMTQLYPPIGEINNHPPQPPP